MRRLVFASALAVFVAMLGLPLGVQATPPVTSSNFQLVGHNPLFSRGMNSAPAIFGNFLYVGNRTDSSDMCVPPTGIPETFGCPHIRPGVLIVNIANPAKPRVVGEIGPPLEGNVRETSRELRVWPQQRLLMVMNLRCSRFYHACPAPPPTPTPNIRFYDLTDPAHPELVSTYFPSVGNLADPRPHEMFLWVDPNDPGRALLYISTFSDDDGLPNIIVTDISGAREGIFREVATFNAVHLYSGQERKNFFVAVHSLSVSPDGTRAHVAVWGGTYLSLDTSDLANDVPKPKIRLLSPEDTRPTWPNPAAHSAVKVLGRPLVITTDELYGDYDDVNDPPGNESGCPWGWARLIDVSDETHPVLVGEYKTAENSDPSFCSTTAGQDDFSSFTAHNLTVLRNLAFVSWHSSGLHAIDITDPAQPTTAGFFVPEPLPSVATEDPALSRGINKVVMWSYPIVRNGLIYVVDIRNGLYVLRYTGPHAREVRGIEFLEGNSNLGDAIALDQP